ncbi:hypothetical protein EV359DRAFT_82831 [Lentinula novae-zelandiae]|nr:hypothetical protein EV359DRAFT_82831 [Lentinula novae-zelandiae]
MDTPDTESSPTPAVKNLLSRFETLAVDNSATASRRKSLQVPMQTSPARAPSDASSSSVSPGLRTVSSSSSLSNPARVTRIGLSPAPPYPFVSPLLRPVPIPNVLNTSVNRAPQHGLPPSPNVSINENEHEEGLTPTFGVSMLRSKFLNVASNTPSRPITHSPKPSILSMIDQPLVPPRVHTSSEPLISFDSPEEYHSQSSSNSMSDLDDPFPEDITDSSTDDPDSSTTAVDPLLPARKPHHHHHHQESTSSSSRNSSESDSGQLFSYNGSASSSQSSIPPPRPPPRPRALALPEPEVFISTSNWLKTPPPLPVRRPAVAQAEDLAAPRTPRPSARLAPLPPHSSHPSTNHFAHVSVSDLNHPPCSAPTTLERKFSGKLPPPTRTIALGDKLPPERSNNAEGAANGDSDEDESGDEDDDKGSGTDLLPDATRASRRPPYLITPHDGDHGAHPTQPCKIAVPAHAGHLAISSVYVVVGSTHYIRLYPTNLSQEVPAKGMDTKDFAIKDGKVTAVEFNTVFLVWISLKEGHIFEIDVRNGDLLGVKRLEEDLPPIFGYLLKYTNLAKGYNPRWFVLRGGVLSYYRRQEDETVASRGFKSIVVKVTNSGLKFTLDNLLPGGLEQLASGKFGLSSSNRSQVQRARSRPHPHQSRGLVVPVTPPLPPTTTATTTATSLPPSTSTRTSISNSISNSLIGGLSTIRKKRKANFADNKSSMDLVNPPSDVESLQKNLHAVLLIPPILEKSNINLHLHDRLSRIPPPNQPHITKHCLSGTRSSSSRTRKSLRTTKKSPRATKESLRASETARKELEVTVKQAKRTQKAWEESMKVVLEEEVGLERQLKRTSRNFNSLRRGSRVLGSGPTSPMVASATTSGALVGEDELETPAALGYYLDPSVSPGAFAPQIRVIEKTETILTT